MNYRTIFSLAARNDLQIIGDFIAQYDPVKAIDFVNQLIDECEAIAEMPEAWPLRPDIRPNIRAMVHGVYVSFYSLTHNTVIVKRIVHGARDLPALFQ